MPRDVIGACAFCEASSRLLCGLCYRHVCADHRVEGTDVCVECGQVVVEGTV